MKLVSLSALLLLTVACNAKQPAAASKSFVFEQWFSYEQPDCGEGHTALTYSLVGSQDHTIAETTLLNVDADSFEASSGEYNRATILDICMDDAGEKLWVNRIVQVIGQGGLGMMHYGLFINETNDATPGLQKAIAENDFSDLELTIGTAGSDRFNTVYLKGWKGLDGKSFVTMSHFEGSDPMATDGRRVIYGELSEGNSLLRRWVKNDRRIEVDGVRIDLRYEIIGKVGLYVSYRFQGATIVDAAAGLDRDLTSEEVERSIDSIGSHHGLTDSAVITLPEVRYTIAESQLKAEYADGSIKSWTLKCNSLPNCGVPLLTPSVRSL